MRAVSGIVLGAVVLSGLAAALAQPTATAPALAILRDEPITPVPPAPSADSGRVALGRDLFHSDLLSLGRDRSCATCHDLGSNGASATIKDRQPDGRLLARNTNTVFNAALSYRLNWLGNADSLESQAEAALLRADLMGVTWDLVLRRLRADADFAAAFERAYARGPDREGVLDALAAFERTLVTPDSRFDLWLRGEHTLSEGEIEGYRLFKSIGCVSCHQGVNVGANLFSRVGIFTRSPSEPSQLMRVPSLRNVAATPPYFHDGRAPTLEDAVRRMGRTQLGRELTKPQVDALTAFLTSLSGRYEGQPVTRPAVR